MLITSSIILMTLYFLLIVTFVIGWKRVFNFVPIGNENLTKKISIVVPCRNEQAHIRQLISIIAQQSYQNFELILVNDHSKDRTRNYIKAAQEGFSKIVLVDAVGYGKKNAIKEGILSSTSDFIVTTDADCLPSYHWLETLVCYQQKYPSDLLICPVKLSFDNNIISYLQVIEFATLVAAGASAVGAGMPILCNAANMAFKKSAWLKSRGDLREDEISGDDIFLLQSVKKNGGVIDFLKAESAFVTTRPATSLREFIHQRRRWASKAPSYTDWQIILVASIVLGVSLLELVLLYFSFFSIKSLILFSSVFAIKYLLDNLFLIKIRKFFQLEHTWLYSVLLSVVYPFYIVFVALSSFIFKPKKW